MHGWTSVTLHVMMLMQTANVRDVLRVVVRGRQSPRDCLRDKRVGKSISVVLFETDKHTLDPILSYFRGYRR